MIEQKFLSTQRLKIAYYHGGTPGRPKLILIHGNASSSKFYLPLMERLADVFEMVAPDLRCFGDTEALPIDATRGLRDWSDDLHSFTHSLGWNEFFLQGWSMGGGIAMQYAIDHGEQLLGLILEDPLSPFGFGGTCTPDGKMLAPTGLASGGGCANPKLVQAILDGDREFLRSTLNDLYIKPPFRAAPEWEEIFVDAIASTRVGDGMYPGDFTSVTQWPGLVPGSRGICNAMSPVYCDLSPIADIPHKCPILWLYGDSDLIVSDYSLADFGALGAMGAVPGWPGADVFPPQPMLAQIRFVLERYAANGGSYREFTIKDSGHGPHVDQETIFAQALTDFAIQSSQF